MLVIMKLLKINNMRKFKHKITGKFAEKTTSGDFYVNNHELIPCWCVENSNDWEEIIEKDYERLLYKGNILYSVKRLSDGVEFKIGDKVCWKWAFAKNKYFTIKSFNIIEGTLKFNTIEESAQNFIFELISKEYNLQHYKEPILTTEDGYECTLDDRVFGVLPKANWQTNYYGKKGVPVFKLFNPEGKRWNPSSEWLWFKTKENAEKYIYENKPEFSRKHILELYEKLKTHTFSYWNILLDEMLIKKGD